MTQDNQTAPTPDSGLMVETASDSALLEEIYPLRARVWAGRGVLIQDFGDGLWNDLHDTHATHWVMRRADGAIVASARICIHEPSEPLPDAIECHGLGGSKIAVLGRLVVDPEYQRSGISRLLDATRIAYARQQGCDAVLASTSAGAARVRSLQAIGFVEYYSVESAVPSGLPGVVLILRLR
jgi:GNAT superfamily N-acetyltransferase